MYSLNDKNFESILDIVKYTYDSMYDSRFDLFEIENYICDVIKLNKYNAIMMSKSKLDECNKQFLSPEFAYDTDWRDYYYGTDEEYLLDDIDDEDYLMDEDDSIYEGFDDGCYQKRHYYWEDDLADEDDSVYEGFDSCKNKINICASMVD